MSMRPRVLADVPEQTAAVAAAAFRKPTLAMRVRDELGEVFADGAFIDAFGIRGKPAISPGQLTLRPRHLHEALRDARAEQQADAWKQTYRARAGIEGTIHQITAVTGIRLVAELPLEDAELVAKGKDLRVLVVVTDRKQTKDGEHLRHGQVGQSQQHDRSSCRPGDQT